MFSTASTEAQAPVVSATILLPAPQEVLQIKSDYIPGRRPFLFPIATPREGQGQVSYTVSERTAQ